MAFGLADQFKGIDSQKDSTDDVRQERAASVAQQAWKVAKAARHEFNKEVEGLLQKGE